MNNLYKNNKIQSGKKLDETNGEDAESDQPKWMKFFSGTDFPKVDFERSLKSQNTELILNFILNNYKDFTFRELILGLSRTNKT